MDDLDPAPYRIGWFTNRRWWDLHRPWQAEADEVRFARRGFTAQAARRKALRDRVALPDRTPHQAWRMWRRKARASLCRIIGHTPYRLMVGPWPRRYPPGNWCKRCLTRLGSVDG